MELIYSDKRIKEVCTDTRAATKLFGGNKQLAIKLHARVNQLEEAVILRDIITIKNLRFHALHGDREGYFAIDVKTHKEPWRIIIQPLDENEEPYMPCNIDQISGKVRIVEISEVSKHYE
ncbi:MAG: hypothetical protein K6E79_08105 [Pseudobutyrivibrio sp.]|nr:hypothetical protein [Pseudobutyrivibrio sp.]